VSQALAQRLAPLTPRRLRLTATALVVLALAYGTGFGGDKDFPFGPLRQFASSSGPNSQVKQFAFIGTDAAGHQITLSPSLIGLHEALVLSDASEFEDHPDRLRNFATARRERKPTDPALVKVALVETLYVLHDRRVTTDSRQTVAEWTAS
jgi:hypothetical protein